MGAIPGYDPNSEDAAEQSAAAWSSLSEADRTRLVSAFTLGLIDWPKEETALLNIFEPLWKESYDKGAGVSAKLYNLQAVQRPELVSTAKLRGGVRVKGITETTQQSIARIVSAGLEHGDSRATIAKQIEQEMQTTASRARTNRYPRVQYLTPDRPLRHDAKGRGRLEDLARCQHERRQTLPQAPER